MFTKENNMENLITKIAKLFADVDAKSFEAIKDNLKAAIDDLNDYWSRTDNPSGTLHDIMTNRCIDRDIVGQIRYRFANYDKQTAFAAVLEMVNKPVIQKQEKRNYRIAKKLFDKGITDISENFEIIYGNDFVGEWVIGDNLVSLKVIFAGGYNIQQLHPRVLVNVKECA